jgi:hypothetical protein
VCLKKGTAARCQALLIAWTNLNKLVGISLEEIPIDKNAIKCLMTAAERNIADAKITAVSVENRFDSLRTYALDRTY